MFHVKHHGLRSHIAMFAMVALLLFAAGCGSVSVPEGWAAPVTAGDFLVVGNGDGSISGFRRSNPASVAWTFPKEPEKSGWSFFGGAKSERETYLGLYATPIVTNVGGRDRVIIATYSGEIIAVDVQTGQRADGWPQSVNVGGHVVATPAFDGKRLFVATHSGTVRTVDATTGELSPAVLLRAAERIWSSPTLDAGTLYVADLAKHVRALDAATGQVRWDRTLTGAATGDATLAGDLLLLPTLDSRLIALDRRTDGAERWQFTTDNWLWAQPLVADGVVYIVSTSGTVYALDLATGQQRWKFGGVQSETRATPVLLAGTLVLATDGGTVFGLDPATGTERWRHQPTEKPRLLAAPLVMDSTIVYTSKLGDIYRVTPKDQGVVERLFQKGS